MNDKDYFSHLYDIASHLNREFSLPSALRRSLEKTTEILGVQTGWIWLTEADHKSVYLAASHNLPPALSDHPERLSGGCYCIKQYLADDIHQAVNISEITCSRLENISSGTNDLKFHATIPIIVDKQKVGLINLLSKETRKLDQKELTILNTISELVGTAIQRTRLQQSYGHKSAPTGAVMSRVSEAVIFPRLEGIIDALKSAMDNDQKIREARRQTEELHNELSALLQEKSGSGTTSDQNDELNYPEMPLTNREMQVLNAIKNGLTNDQIGQQLFIAERTVKFHVSAILSKLRASNRTEAVDIALKRGILSI